MRDSTGWSDLAPMILPPYRWIDLMGGGTIVPPARWIDLLGGP